MPDMLQDHLAFDRASVRTVDPGSGHLHVSVANISKANVCPYNGSEIPDAERLGLSPRRTYMLLRDPGELEKAAGTFEGKPLLDLHKPQTAATHDHSLTVGSVSNVRWNAPYLQAAIAVWEAAAIAGIDTGEVRQLSCGYHYDADMTPGEYEGVKYDGRMVNLRGNHVALVEEGRAGPDVMVGDAKHIRAFWAGKFVKHPTWFGRFAAAPPVRYRLRIAHDWTESDHPRGENGQFGDGSGFKKDTGHLGGAELTSSQDYIDDDIVEEKRRNQDYSVQVSPEFDVGGQAYRSVLDGHHSLQAAFLDGVEPLFEEQDKRDNDNVALLEAGNIDGFLEQTHNGSDYHNPITKHDSF